jgi:hypothetical protein
MATNVREMASCEKQREGSENVGKRSGSVGWRIKSPKDRFFEFAFLVSEQQNFPI